MKILSLSSVCATALFLCACGGGSSDDDANTSPTISLAEKNMSVEVGDDVTLDASASSDPEGESLTFLWSGDANVASPESSKTVVSGLQVGSYEFTLTVSDGENQVSDKIVVVVTGPQVVETTGLATGSISQPTTVYYDIDAGRQVELTEAEASANDDWDIAFRRTKVMLNSDASTPVSLYFTGNVDEFYDAEGGVVLERFINATPSTELAAFESQSATLPEGAEFHGDSVEPVIGDFYSYDVTTHMTSANDDAYFVVSSDDAITKLRATELVQDGFGMSAITLELAYQADGESTFAQPRLLQIDGTNCDIALYVDLDSAAIVDASAAWDISIPCNNGLATYEINLAGDALAFGGELARVSGIADESFAMFPWSENDKAILAYTDHGDSRSQYGWGEYGINGGHTLWPNYATYIIKTAQGQYKFQVIGYYDVDTGASGSYSIRHQRIVSN